MELSKNYKVIQKEVKHARIRVSEDGGVRVILPWTFSEDDAEALLEKKSKWIAKNLKFFEGKSRIELQRNQLLLFGNRYNYFYDTTFEQKVIIDHDHRTIRSKRNLLDVTIQQKWYRGIAKDYLIERTEDLAEKLKFKYEKIYIRNQKTKWGNCSAEKNISLNWRLIKAPLFVIDYLIIHELVHTEIMNHQGRFWTMLRSYYPYYRDAVKWLDKYGNSL